MKSKVLSILSVLVLGLTMAQASSLTTTNRNSGNCACCEENACDCCNHGNAAASNCCDCNCCNGGTCTM